MIAAGRFKRALLGYRRAEVDAAFDAAADEARVAAEELESRGQKLDELERVANRLAERVVERERELRAVRAELAEATRKSAVSLEALEALVKELERSRQRPPEGRPAAGAGTAAEASPEPQAVTEPEPESAQVIPLDPERGAQEERSARAEMNPVPAASNGHSPSAGPELFEGCVEVDIGPLGDFAQLVGFEDAARGIGGTAEISILRFSAGRATLELTLEHPVELLDELERRCAMEFKVRDNRDGRIVLDVD